MAGASSRCHMKPKSLCPKCGELFSRKWNMREHCRTQHHYDPDPNPRPSPIRQGKNKELINSSVNSTGLSMASAPVVKFLKMMSNSVRFQQTGIGNSTNAPLANSMGSIENALDYLLENFVVVGKKEFNGLSGYFCKKCVTFQYRYITNLWQDRTAKDEHLLHTVHTSPDVNRLVNQYELQIQAGAALIELTNSLFPGEKIFTLCPPVPFANGPVIKLDSLSVDKWAEAAIMKTGQVIEDDSYLNGFLMRAKGTYAQIIISSGPFKGTYFIAVQKSR